MKSRYFYNFHCIVKFHGGRVHVPHTVDPTSPSPAREDSQLRHPGEPNEDDEPVDTEFVGAGYSLLTSTSNK